MTSICNGVKGWARAQYTHGDSMSHWIGISAGANGNMPEYREMHCWANSRVRQ